VAGLEAETASAQGAIEILGGCVREVKSLDFPGLVPGRCLVAIDKIIPTPEKYPRRPGMPAKKPLL